MNQVHLFEILKTTVINLKDRPDNRREFSANSKTRSTPVIITPLPT
jgi:hypothetical protein